MAKANKNLEIYDALANPPKNAKKSIQAGRLKGMTSINPMWRIKALTEIFGPFGKGWYDEYEDLGEFTSEETGVTLIRLRCKLYIKYPGEENWSIPAVGYGSAALVAREKAGLRVDDDAYKKAKTDAFGNAAKSFGVGADVYFKAEDDNKYASEKSDTAPIVAVAPLPPKSDKGEPVTEEQAKHLDEIVKDRGKKVDKMLAYVNGQPEREGNPAESLNSLNYGEYCAILDLFNK